MPVIIPTGFAQVTMHWVGPFDSGRAATVFGLGHTDPPFIPLLGVCNVVRDAWVNELAALTDANVSLDSVEAIDATDSAEISVGVAGGEDGNLVAPNVALLVRKVVPGRGRRRQGRMFWPGVVFQGGISETGTLLGGNQAAFQAAFDAWYAAISTDLSTDMVILQNSEGETPPITPPPPVASLFVEAKVASQRRRLRA